VAAASLVLLLAGSASAQVQILVRTAADVHDAFTAANSYAFRSGPTNPVVIEFANGLIGQSIRLTRVPPTLVVDYVTIRVQGAAATDRVTFDASDVTGAFRINSHYARVENLAFVRAGRNTGTADGVFAAGCHELTFANCDFDESTAIDLWLVGSTNVSVLGCNLRNGGGLVAMDGSHGLVVANCTILGNPHGIRITGCNDARVQGCTFDGNGGGVLLQPSCSRVTFGPGNTVRNCRTTARFTGAAGMRVIGGSGIVVDGNVFADNDRGALQISDLAVGVLVRGNLFQRNGLPMTEPQVLVEDSVDVRCEDDRLQDGGAGITALRSRQVAVVGTGAGTAEITGHRRHALVLGSSIGVLVDRLAMRGNLTAVEAAQVSVLDSSDVTLSQVDVVGPAVGGTRTGIQIVSSRGIRLGHGSAVSAHAFEGVVLDDCQDVTLGNWQPGSGSLTVRGGQPLRLVDSDRVTSAGDASAATLFESGTSAGAHTVFVVRSDDLHLGPAVTIDGHGTANAALQAADSARLRLDGLRVVGHRSRGLLLERCPGSWIGFCQVDGRVGAVASAEGVLLNGACDGAEIIGNEVRGHEGTAFKVVDTGDVSFLPGNRAVDNGGDGFAADDTGAGPPHRRIMVQSAAAVGRGSSGQSAFRCSNMLVDLSSITATRHGSGILLQRGTQATIVNSISYGNASYDRVREPTATGRLYSCVVRTSAGTGSPGAWIDNDVSSTDPRFVAPASGDVRLGSGSPAIDSGLHLTPFGTRVPAVDVGLQPRVRGNRIDRGCSEFVPSGGAGNSLELAGAWLRPPAEARLQFALDFGAGNGLALLLGSGSGTGTGFRLPDNSLVPLVPDNLTFALLGVQAWSVVPVASGRGSADVAFPAWVLPYLPTELTYVAVPPGGGSASNPVVVRFLR